MSPRVDHFIVRPDMDDGTPGPIVPLIAVDQLPDWIQLTGVPRELDAEQILGLINLGMVDKEDDSVFEVRLHDNKTRAILNGQAESHSPGGGQAKAKSTNTKKTVSFTETKGKSVEKAANEKTPFSFAGSSSAIQPGPLEQQQPRMLSASRHNVANTAVGTQAPNSSDKPIRPHMTEATRDKPRPAGPKNTTTNNKQDKQNIAICGFWCQNGFCKWEKNCHKQHRMPATVEGLREVGLTDYPKWYRDKMNKMNNGAVTAIGARLPGLLTIDATHSGSGDAQSPKQQQQPPSPLGHLIQFDVLNRPSEDLHQLQDHMSAPLASSSEVSSRQKPKQNKKPQTQTQAQGQKQQQQQPRPHSNNGNYANVSTNASVAANAANHRRQAERQQQLRNDMPVATRVKARLDVNDKRSQGTLAGRAGVGEVNILDIF